MAAVMRLVAKKRVLVTLANGWREEIQRNVFFIWRREGYVRKKARDWILANVDIQEGD